MSFSSDPKAPGVIGKMSHFEKDGWRKRNLEFLRVGEIGTYAETVGDSGDKMYTLLKPYLKSPQQFVGFDRNRRCVYLHRITEQPWYCSYTVDAFWACSKLAGMSKEERLEIGLSELPLNVCNFDVQRNVGNDTWWKEEGARLPSIVDRMLIQSPRGVSVILNHTLDWNKKRPDENIPVHIALIHHTERLCGLFKDWEGATPDVIHGRQSNLEAALKNTGRTSHHMVSKYEIYVGDRSRLRMATLRIRFTEQRGRRRMTLWPSTMLRSAAS